ncbi:class I SAM-dependent methyltransferase [Raineyella sp. LH-20]|uniref:class I SAM-dependent methyltransferase n=1 Tax=Raineyella sp. LH-20 TaxID=3081204 RepID=UPI0029557A95|nr:methyltransferase [Raineyella sp. LH-20]WOP19945.1 methyltransferase [Raineyella sp. LH-20]
MLTLDAVDDLILAEAATVEAGSAVPAAVAVAAVGSGRAPVLVLDAPALAAELARQGRTVLHRADLLADEEPLGEAIPGGVVESWDDLRLGDVRLVLLRLPANLNALDELAEAVAAHCHPEVRLVAGARVKHMTRGMNEVLAGHFAEVRASLGVRKCRVLHAASPLPAARATGAAPSWPRTAVLPASEVGAAEPNRPAPNGTAPTGTAPNATAPHGADLTVVAYGATFAGNRLDLGTRLLLDRIASLCPRDGADRAVDLGCGSGILAAVLARNGWHVTGVDTSRAAVAATAATAAANGLTIDVRRADALTDWPAADLDLVVCNPPFHVGTAKDSSPAFRMIRTAARALRPGGELWCVYNAHLPYLPALRRDVGPTEIITRDRSYLVTRSIRAAR